jgi:hypothetical protein
VDLIAEHPAIGEIVPRIRSIDPPPRRIRVRRFPFYGKRPLNGTYRWSARSGSLLCQEVRHGREEDEHEATESKRVAGPVGEAG